MNARAVLTKLLKTAADMPGLPPVTPKPATPAPVGGGGRRNNLLQTALGATAGSGGAYAATGDVNQGLLWGLGGAAYGNPTARAGLMAKGSPDNERFMKALSNNTKMIGGKAALSAGLMVPGILEDVKSTTGNIASATAGAEGTGAMIKDTVSGLRDASGNVSAATGKVNAAAGKFDAMAGNLDKASQGTPKLVESLTAGADAVQAGAKSLDSVGAGIKDVGTGIQGIGDIANKGMEAIGKHAPAIGLGVGGLALLYILQKEMASRRKRRRGRD